MLRNDAVARSLAVRIAPEDFTDPLFRRAAERIFAVLGAGRSLDVRSLAVEGDDELNRLISHYAVLETDYADAGTNGDLEKACADCVERVKQQGSTKKMKTLLAAIQAQSPEATGSSSECCSSSWSRCARARAGSSRLDGPTGRRGEDEKRW